MSKLLVCDCKNLSHLASIWADSFYPTERKIINKTCNCCMWNNSVNIIMGFVACRPVHDKFKFIFGAFQLLKTTKKTTENKLNSTERKTGLLAEIASRSTYCSKKHFLLCMHFLLLPIKLWTYLSMNKSIIKYKKWAFEILIETSYF